MDAGKEILGPGTIYFDWGETGELAVGYTKGGSVFNSGVEWRETEADQDKGPTKGHRNKTRIAPMLTVEALEVFDTAKIIKFFQGMSVDASDETYNKISETYVVADTDYLTNVAFVGQNKDGKDVAIVLYDVLGDGQLEASIVKDEEIVVSTQFTAHWDPDATDTDKAPYEIWIEKTA